MRCPTMAVGNSSNEGNVTMQKIMVVGAFMLASSSAFAQATPQQCAESD
jgi:hypothetical protein